MIGRNFHFVRTKTNQWKQFQYKIEFENVFLGKNQWILKGEVREKWSETKEEKGKIFCDTQRWHRSNAKIISHKWSKLAALIRKIIDRFTRLMENLSLFDANANANANENSMDVSQFSGYWVYLFVCLCICVFVISEI